MPISLKLDVVEKNLMVALGLESGAAAKSRMLADFAREALADAIRQNAANLGREPRYQTYVDGHESTNLDAVRPDGQIIFEFELLDDVLGWISEQLLLHSPVGSQSDKRPGHPGLYRASHVLTADGDEIYAGQPLPQADEYAFVSTVPYARKIENGLSEQAPEGVYEVVAVLAQKRFGNIARIRFGFRAPLFGDIHVWASTTPSGKHRRADRAEWLRRQPAIVITPR